MDGTEPDLDSSLTAPGDCRDDVEFELELDEEGGVDEMPLVSAFDGEIPLLLLDSFWSLP